MIASDGGTIDLTEVDRSMSDVERRSKLLAPAFRELRVPLRRDQARHAKDQAGPGGSWPPRSPFTEARRKSRNRGRRVTKAMKVIGLAKSKRRPTPKRILGRLPGAVIYTVGQLFIRATSRVPWSGIHQRGGRAGRGVKIPAREFLWLSMLLLETTSSVLARYVAKGWQR